MSERHDSDGTATGVSQDRTHGRTILDNESDEVTESDMVRASVRNSVRWADVREETLAAEKVGQHETFGLEPTPSRQVDARFAAENPELWELVQSLPEGYLDPFREHVSEFRERYGPLYSIRTPQQLVFEYITSGYAKPKFRISGGKQILVGLVAT